MGRRTGAIGEPRPQHSLHRANAARQGLPHHPFRQRGRARRRSGAMTRGVDAVLVLNDGTEFEGEAIGALRSDADGAAVAVGEVVFNTALSGYQEIVTDPSYAGQVITFTYPHIGNYGVNADDD